MKIDKTQKFTVDRGTDIELEKTWNIIKANGIRLYTHEDDFKSWVLHYPINNGFNFDGITFMSGINNKAKRYTPSEFHAKYGDLLTPKYPFELVGEVIEHNGRYLRAVDFSKPMILDGVEFYGCTDNNIHGIIKVLTKMLAIVKSPTPFVSGAGDCWEFAWVEVDPPEPKMVTREMTAQEIVALGDIWVMIGDASHKLYRSELCLDPNGDLQFHGRLTKHCRYSYLPDATEWLPFTVTEHVK